MSIPDSKQEAMNPNDGHNEHLIDSISNLPRI